MIVLARMLISIVFSLGTTDIVAELGRNPTQCQTAIDCPLVTTSEAMLVTQVAVDIEVFTLPSLTTFPFEVIIATSQSETDMPSVERVVLLAVTQPVAQFHAEVHELLSMCVMAPCPPRPEELTFDTPAVGLTQ